MLEYQKAVSKVLEVIGNETNDSESYMKASEALYTMLTEISTEIQALNTENEALHFEIENLKDEIFLKDSIIESYALENQREIHEDLHIFNNEIDI